MYSPKVNEEYIPVLYQLKQATGKPMTLLVNEAISEYLGKRGVIINDRQNKRCLKDNRGGDAPDYH